MMIIYHLELNDETSAFHFQACTLARRNAEVFLKYIHRNSVTMANISGHSVTVSGVTEVTGHSRVPEQQVKGEQTQGAQLLWGQNRSLRNSRANWDGLGVCLCVQGSSVSCSKGKTEFFISGH